MSANEYHLEPRRLGQEKARAAHSGFGNCDRPVLGGLGVI